MQRMSLRERLDTLSRGELAGLAVVLVVTLAGAGLWYARSLPRPVTVSEAAGPLTAVAPGAEVSPSGEAVVGEVAATVIVDVTGLVRRPGVYELSAGARVIDAIEQAGGAKEAAELSLLNLAAVLVDGQQIVVLKEGAAPPAGAPGAPAVPGMPGALVNVNTADAAALDTLPGIGEVMSAAIIQYRTEHGPFTSVDQLEDVSGIGPATLEKLRPLVTV